MTALRITDPSAAAKSSDLTLFNFGIFHQPRGRWMRTDHNMRHDELVKVATVAIAGEWE